MNSELRAKCEKHGEVIMVSDGDWESGKFEYATLNYTYEQMDSLISDICQERKRIRNEVLEEAASKYEFQEVQGYDRIMLLHVQEILRAMKEE